MFRTSNNNKPFIKTQRASCSYCYIYGILLVLIIVNLGHRVSVCFLLHFISASSPWLRFSNRVFSKKHSKILIIFRNCMGERSRVFCWYTFHSPRQFNWLSLKGALPLIWPGKKLNRNFICKSDFKLYISQVCLNTVALNRDGTVKLF